MQKIQKNMNSHLKEHVTCFCKKDNKTIRKHIHTFKGLCVSLTAIEKLIPDKEFFFPFTLALALDTKLPPLPCLKAPRPYYIKLASQL